MATTILVKEETRDLLKIYGKKDDTYDQIISRLIKIAEKCRFFEEQKFILENEKFFKAEDL
ncbi:MAG: hypothetical protein Q7R70_04860 [Candidatus Diapherotrites archaeon]|nr:hypothetical protein [Candidatus Diapherotrites archaeon]